MGRNKSAAISSSKLAKKGRLKRDTADYRVETMMRSLYDMLNTQ